MSFNTANIAYESTMISMMLKQKQSNYVGLKIGLHGHILEGKYNVIYFLQLLSPSQSNTGLCVKSTKQQNYLEYIFKFVAGG